jgi:small GTP-binding protein
MKQVKCVVVGDAGVGKTCLLISYTTNASPGDYIPTELDNYSTHARVRDEAVNLSLWDTAGREEFKQVRTLSYANAHAIALCFSVASPDSFVSVKSAWVAELARHAPATPILLVGTKIDLRSSDQFTLQSPKAKGQAPVSRAQAIALKNEIGAVNYIGLLLTQILAC